MKKIFIILTLIFSFVLLKAQDVINLAAGNNFSEYYDKGVKYFFDDKIQEAEKYFLEALGNKPDDINTLKYLAEIAVAKQNPLMIKYYYDRVLKLDSNNEDALISLGVIHLNNGNFKIAEEMLIKAVNNKPNNELALFNLGVLYGTIGELSKAVNTFNDLISVNAKNSEYYQTLGMYYLIQNLFTEAEINFLKALNLDNKLIEARKGLVIVYQNENKLDKSLKYLNELESLSPDLQHLNILKSNQLYLQSKIDPAIKYALLEIEKYPDESDAYYLLGDLYKINGDELNSHYFFEKAEKLNKNYPNKTIYSFLNIK